MVSHLLTMNINISLSFYQIDLPEYSSKEVMEGKLLLAITEGKEGFVIA